MTAARATKRPFNLSVKEWSEVVRSAQKLPHSTATILERGLIDTRFFCHTFLDWDPTAKQELWVRGMFKVGHIVAGRRGGKSECEAARDAKLLIYGPTVGTRPGFRAINVARTVDQSKLVPNTMVSLLSRTKIGRWFIEGIDRAPFMRVRVRGGGELWARTTQNGGDNLRGHWADKVNRDEGAYGGSRDLNVILPMLADRNGTISATTTPNARNHYWMEYETSKRDQAHEARRRGVTSLVDDVELLDTLALHWTSFDNPHVSHESLERWARKFGPKGREQELMAIFNDVEGALCKPSDLEPVEDGGIRDDDLELWAERHYVDGAQFVAGMDVGRWRAFTVVIIMRVDVKPWRAVEIFATRKQGWEWIKGRCDEIIGRYRASALIDTTHGSQGDVLHEWMRVQSQKFEFTASSKDQLMLNLKFAIDERRFVLPGGVEWEELYRQLQLWGTDEEDSYGDETWDYLMALALAVWQASHRPERPGGFAVSRHRAGDAPSGRRSDPRPRARDLVRRP